MKNKRLLELALFGFASGVAALAYRALLTVEARESISDLRSTIKESRDTIKSKIEDIRGQVMEDDGLTDNRMRTRKQWQDLGY